jgi:hypothetical protein
MMTYRLSRSGRRMTLILIAAALLLAVFALLTLQTALGFRYLNFAATFGAALGAGFGVGQLIPAALLLLMLVAAPLLLWSLWEEWSTSYTVAADGLTYRTIGGISLHYPWSAIRTIRRGEGDEAIAELIVAPGADAQIRNPALRWLHRQAFGQDRVPIYPGVEARDQLVAQIVEYARLDEAKDRTQL